MQALISDKLGHFKIIKTVLYTVIQMESQHRRNFLLPPLSGFRVITPTTVEAEVHRITAL